MEQPKNQQLVIIHFNDVYNIEERKMEPVGGVARFKTVLESVREPDCVTLFSGDLFHPSLLSTAYDGIQMIKPMNSFHIDAACFGNHEFDMDLDILLDQIKQTNFPWLISNVKNKSDWRPIAKGLEKLVIQRPGIKIGVIGIAEKEWVYDVASLDLEEITFEDPVACARRLNTYLREVDQCDMVIALTHMRIPNDQKLAKEFNELDFILGGHDHFNYIEKTNGTYIIKSGTDFCEFNKIVVTLLDKEAIEKLPLAKKAQIYKGKYLVDFKTLEVTSAFEPDEELKAHVNEYYAQFDEKMKQAVLYSSVPLETRFEQVRSSEQNFSNFLADIIRLDSGSDCSIINTGCLRSNCLFQEGVKTLADIRLILPFEDMVMKVRLTGQQLLRALENSVSTFPALDGRFLAVSGITFTFDPKRSPNHRVPLEYVKMDGVPLDLNANYTMATTVFIARGKDGFTVFNEVEKLNEENGAEGIHTVLKRFFTLTKDPNIVEEFKKLKGDDSSGSIGSISDLDFLKPPSLERRISEVKRMNLFKKLTPIIQDILFINGEYLISISPVVEKRINQIY